jgi:colicin import membrane protein
VIRKATAISAGLHAAVLLWATVSFSGRSFEATPTESLPVDLVSESQFTKLTQGVKDAPKPKEKPKPLVEKKAPEVKPAEESKPKLTEKQEVQATKPKPAEPPPAPESKPVEKKEAKADDKPPVPVAKEKADPIAEKLKKEEAKKETKPEKLPPRRPPRPQHKLPEFNPDKIAALLDQRDPQRHAATGDTLNANATLGRAHGTAARLSASEIDALRRRISECWQAPVGADGSQNLQVVFRVMFNPDGSVKRGPDLVEAAASSLGPIFAESARRAILQCQPYTMLHKETYDQWKDMEMVFNLRDMFR